MIGCSRTIRFVVDAREASDGFRTTESAGRTWSRTRRDVSRAFEFWKPFHSAFWWYVQPRGRIYAKAFGGDRRSANRRGHGFRTNFVDGVRQLSTNERPSSRPAPCQARHQTAVSQISGRVADPFRTAKDHGGIRLIRPLPSTSLLVNTRGHEFCDFEPVWVSTSSATDRFEFAARQYLWRAFCFWVRPPQRAETVSMIRLTDHWARDRCALECSVDDISRTLPFDDWCFGRWSSTTLCEQRLNLSRVCDRTSRWTRQTKCAPARRNAHW